MSMCGDIKPTFMRL